MPGIEKEKRDTMKFLEKNPIIMIVVGILGVSMSAIFVRLSQAPSAVTAACRLLWTVALMTPAVLGRRETRQELLHVGRRALLMSAASGVLLALHFLSWFESLRHTGVASSAILVSTEVIWVALGYCLFLQGRLGKKAVAAIAVTLAGSVMIACSDASGSGNSLYGDFLAVAAAVAVAGYTLLGRQVRREVSTAVYTYIVYLCCGTVLLVIVAVKGYALTGYGGSGILYGLLLAVFSTILGHSVFSWCLKYFSPTFVSASKLCEPVLSTMAAGFLFGEIPTALQLFGGVVVLAGVIYYSAIEVKGEAG